MNGTTLIEHILLAVSTGATRLWRQNAGQAWAGKAVRYTRLDHVTVYPGDVIVRQGRPIKLGEKGISDTVGYTMVEVTQEMVGSQLAVFTAIEAKGDGDTPTAKQVAFIERIRRHGGRAGVAYSPEDAARIAGGEVLGHSRLTRK